MAPRCQLLTGSFPSTSRLFRGRCFSTSTVLLGRKGGDLGSHLPVHVIPKDANIPPYPHGPALLFKQSNRGLYGGQRIQFGNNVSSKTETKTRRHWKPNVVTKGLYSITLKKRIKLRVTSKVLKTMDHEGGLDEYLLKESRTRIEELGPVGWALRWTLMQQPEVIDRFRAEAATLGLPQHIIDERWPKSNSSRKETTQRKEERLQNEQAAAEERTLASKAKADQIHRNFLNKRAMAPWVEKYRKSRVAPDTASATVLAKERFARNNRQIRIAGTKYRWQAWQKAKDEGEVATAGGDESWFAERTARTAVLQQEHRLLREQKEQAKSLRNQEDRVSKKDLSDPVDEWASLASGKTEPSSNRVHV